MTITKKDKAYVLSSYANRLLGFSLWKDGTIFLNFHVDFTLRCNGGCVDCCKMLGLLPMNSRSSDFTQEHVEIVAKIFRLSKIRVRRLRVSGGEPLLNPEFVTLFNSINRLWRPVVIRVYTNGTIQFPSGVDHGYATMRPLSLKEKKVRHVPFYVSPADLGMEPMHGHLDACRMATECGRSVNAFGFTPCMQYPHIGRLLGKDVHTCSPKLFGDAEVCQHCICSLPRIQQRRIREMVANQKIEYPTRFYREGMERERESLTRLTLLLDKLQKRGC